MGSTLETDETSTSNQVVAPAKANISTLPPELILLISQNLTYPDALSLKHTSRSFYSLVYTGLKLKIEWLIERRSLHLDCPHDKRCELGSDMRFCRGSVWYFPLFRKESSFRCLQSQILLANICKSTDETKKRAWGVRYCHWWKRLSRFRVPDLYLAEETQQV